jgi:CRISPR/Cas system-associated exonuclease Cas4 (RecB family)
MISQADQVGKVLQDMLTGGLINPEQQAELAELMEGILKNPEISCFFDPAFEIKNEPEILTPEGVLYRPDRVLMKNNRATIIDYKTGRQHPGHRDQVLKYASLLNEMNCTVDSAFLLYLNRNHEVVKVI